MAILSTERVLSNFRENWQLEGEWRKQPQCHALNILFFHRLFIPFRYVFIGMFYL